MTKVTWPNSYLISVSMRSGVIIQIIIIMIALAQSAAGRKRVFMLEKILMTS